MPDLNDEGISKLADVAITTDLSTVGQTTFYTVPPNNACIPFAGFLKADGDVGANLEFTMGQVGALTDFIGTTNGDNLDADEDGIWILPIPSATPAKVKVYPAGTVLQFDLTVAGNAVAGRLFFWGMLFSV